jgi:DnaJ-class molecular chaperone
MLLIACLRSHLLLVVLATHAFAFRPEGVDPYKALKLERGVELDAKTLKKAYRAQALRWHPDKVTKEDRPKAEKKFIAIAWAYEVLSDPVKRKEFESGMPQPDAQGAGASGGAADARDFSMKDAAKVFEDVFGSGSAEYNDLIQHLATASGSGDREHWKQHAQEIKQAMGKTGKDFSVETKSKDGSGTIKTSQSISDDGKGTVSKTVVTESTHTSSGPAALGGGGHAALSHEEIHAQAVRAAQEAHERAMRQAHGQIEL